MSRQAPHSPRVAYRSPSDHSPALPPCMLNITRTRTILSLCLPSCCPARCSNPHPSIPHCQTHTDPLLFPCSCAWAVSSLSRHLGFPDRNKLPDDTPPSPRASSESAVCDMTCKRLLDLSYSLYNFNELKVPVLAPCAAGLPNRPHITTSRSGQTSYNRSIRVNSNRQV